MAEPSKFEIVMAAIQQIQSQLDDIDVRLRRIERSTLPSSEPPQPPGNLERQNEFLSRESRKKRYVEDWPRNSGSIAVWERFYKQSIIANGHTHTACRPGSKSLMRFLINWKARF